jgi:hypothetical protein
VPSKNILAEVEREVVLNGNNEEEDCVLNGAVPIFCTNRNMKAMSQLLLQWFIVVNVL